jgi:hypothetical protein
VNPGLGLWQYHPHEIVTIGHMIESNVKDITTIAKGWTIGSNEEYGLVEIHNFSRFRDEGIKKMVKQVTITLKRRQFKKFIDRRINEQLIISWTINEYIKPIYKLD